MTHDKKPEYLQFHIYSVWFENLTTVQILLLAKQKGTHFCPITLDKRKDLAKSFWGSFHKSYEKTWDKLWIVFKANYTQQGWRNRGRLGIHGHP